MKRFFLFVSSMILSLTVFLLPWGFSFYPEEENVKISENVIIPKEKEALFMIEEKEKPVLFLHIRLNYNEAFVTSLLPSLIAKDTDGSFPLSAIVSNGGLKYAVTALNRSFGYNITRYFSLEQKSLTELMTAFGSCDYTLPSPILSENGEILFKEGRRLLNSEKAEIILKHAYGLSLNERANLYLKILLKMINERGELSSYETENIFNSFANGRDNNLSVTDLLRFKNYNLFKEGFIFKAAD